MEFRRSILSPGAEWRQAPDLSAAVEEALERSIWLRERAQEQAGRITAALGADWRPLERAADEQLGNVPAVHVELLEPWADLPPGALLCRRAPVGAFVLAQRADGNAEAYEAEITCKSCLAAVVRLSPPHGNR